VGKRSHYPIWGDDALEALECLKSWRWDGLVAATREGIKVMDEMLCELDF